MPFRPQVNDKLTINGVSYVVSEHPTAPGIPYGQEGRQATVYQLVTQDEEKRALKVFKARHRSPSLTTLADKLGPFAVLPGLQICHRTVLTPHCHGDLLSQHPDLAHAVLMPWIEGPTWSEVMLEKHELTPEQSLGLARSLAGALAAMEEQGLAHCDLSGPNLLLPGLEGVKGSLVALVDIEQLYGPGLERPELLPGGSPGYAHKTAPDGLWGVAADRFAGAVLLAEILGWCDEQVREAAWGEQYFAGEEMQKETQRSLLLTDVLRGRWGEGVAAFFRQAWQSQALADCPAFEEWLTVLPEEMGAVSSMAEVDVDEERAGSAGLSWRLPEDDKPELAFASDVREQLARTRLQAEEDLLLPEQPGQTVSELMAAYELDPVAAWAPLARALMAKAQRAEEVGDKKSALESYQWAMEVTPEGSALWEEVSAILAGWEQQGEVVEELAAQAEASTPSPAVPAEKPGLVQRRRVLRWVCSVGALVIVGGLLVLMATGGGFLALVFGGRAQPMVAPAGTPTRTPAPIHTSTRKPFPSATATERPTATPTEMPVVTPVLMFPEQGQTYRSPITFQWRGGLGSGQFYLVRAWHAESGFAIESSSMWTTSWTADLPAEKFGDWRWNVSVLQNGRVVVTSAEGMFWFDPFPGSRS